MSKHFPYYCLYFCRIKQKVYFRFESTPLKAQNSSPDSSTVHPTVQQSNSSLSSFLSPAILFFLRWRVIITTVSVPGGVPTRAVLSVSRCNHIEHPVEHATAGTFFLLSFSACSPSPLVILSKSAKQQTQDSKDALNKVLYAKTICIKVR